MQPKKQDPLKNPLVYLDIAIDGELAGRIICELRKDVVPKTAENFRSLCTGERGIGINRKPLWFKGCKFHKAIVQFMVQSGDIINNDGTGGESIYGSTFPDENFILKHEEGVLSMANQGRPHTNGSQFCVTTVPCPHLNGRNVVFGRVVSGLGVLVEIQRLSGGDDCRPRLDCVIVDCGELRELNERNTCCADGTPDRLPEYPDDYTRTDVTTAQLVSFISVIKQCGNDLFEVGRWAAAVRKYLKCLRYLGFVKEAVARMEEHHDRDQYFNVTMTFRLQCNLNLAACYLKLQEYSSCIKVCNEVLQLDARSGKALYRRAQAHFALADYDAALGDLRRAARAAPGDRAVRALLLQVQRSYKQYNGIQKQRLSKFFRDHEQEAAAKSAGD